MISHAAELVAQVPLVVALTPPFRKLRVPLSPQASVARKAIGSGFCREASLHEQGLPIVP